MTVRKNITMDEKDYLLISDYATKNGYTFSQILRNATISFINKSEKMELLEYMNANLEYVNKEEQREIEDMDIDFHDLNGEEIKVQDVL